MTWSNRFRLVAGLLAVLVVAALLTFHLNQQRGLATSSSGSITAENYDVGTPYAGLVTDQLVKDGDTVTAGQKLFVIDSAALRNELSLGLAPTSTAASVVSADGTLAVTATSAGKVTEIDAETGTFVQGSAIMAKIDRAQTLKVKADFTLSPREYARVADNAPVTIVLPNQQALSGTVDSMDVQTNDGSAEAVVTVVSKQLTDGAENGLVASGTPVTAQLHLRNDGVVSTVADKVQGFFREHF
ncbi:HlyD family efflux transporter periplasmic adaptor subunit [Cellulomonas sp. McL0617]|uniref:HlyD family efflux transporter periplasmic adaptor subunit n=1 Tax=Cellulomonas sp. McL0617 TaxID=3415675 RepID=UPI003CF1E6D5